MKKLIILSLIGIVIYLVLSKRKASAEEIPQIQPEEYIPQKDEYCERVMMGGITVVLCANTREALDAHIASLRAKGTTVIRIS